MKRRVNWKRFFQMCVLCAASCTAATPNHVGLVFLSAPGAPFSRFSIHCIHRNTMHFYTPNFHADGKFCSHSIRSTWIFTFFIPFNCILGSRARVTDAYIRWKKNIYIALKSLLFTAICDMNIWMACTLVVSHKWWWKVLHVVALSTHSLHCIISIYSVCCVWQCKMQSAVRSSECWWRLFISTAIPLVIFIDIVRCNTNAVLLSFDGFR